MPLAGPPPLADVFASNVGRYLSFEFGYDQAMLMFQPVGGMDRIPQALAKAVGGHRIQLGAQVTGVTDRAGGVEVTYRLNGLPRAITADYCIATLPPHLMARIPHNLGAGRGPALAAFPPVPAGKIGLEYRSRWWENDLRIYGGITETDLDVAHIWYPSHDFHARRGLLVGYYTIGPDAETYGALTHRAAGRPRGRAGREDPRRQVPHRAGRLVLRRLAADAAHRGRVDPAAVGQPGLPAAAAAGRPGLLRRRLAQPRGRLAARRLRLGPGRGHRPAPARPRPEAATRRSGRSP